MKPFSEDMRYEHDLTPDSWVVDVGAHHGDFAREITRRYDCYVLGFEPHFDFWCKAYANQSPKVLIVPIGLGDCDCEAIIGVAGDATGMFCDSNDRAKVKIRDVHLLGSLLPMIDLLKLNCEGAEYAILERIIEKDMQHGIDNIQVQFHQNAPDYHARRLSIMDKLADTHVLTYEYPYVWESWTRR